MRILLFCKEKIVLSWQIKCFSGKEGCGMSEKFSGKGYAAYICKNGSKLSAVQKAQAMTINQLTDFPIWLLLLDIITAPVFSRGAAKMCFEYLLKIGLAGKMQIAADFPQGLVRIY